MFDRLKSALSAVSEQGAGDDEGRAALEALLLVVYADRLVRQVEIEAIEAIDERHPDWVSDTFSVAQALGPATAAVRTALETDGEAALLASIAERITSPELRAEVGRLCEEIARSDRETAGAETATIERIRAALA